MGILTVYMVTMLLLGVSAPEPSSCSPSLAAVAPSGITPPNPSELAFCSRFCFREYMAKRRAPTIMQAASTPIMIKTIEVVPFESVGGAADPLLATSGTMLLSSFKLDDIESLKESLKSEDKELFDLESELMALVEPGTKLDSLGEPERELTESGKSTSEFATLPGSATFDVVDVLRACEELVKRLKSCEAASNELSMALEVVLDVVDESKSVRETSSHLSPLNPSLHEQLKPGRPFASVDTKLHVP
ncbi:hypothetical protein CCR75_004626 [Bremia lactucae]|uniref:Uncharacterized protein n=1 Tax=Bremia lactucae TaxID=4779 RepID=A0A976P078_BRELC|nr:hypothetical protein CCR75_004626 [Bremia lactucae]